MKKNTKKQVIVVPTTQKIVLKTKSAKNAKSRSACSKSSAPDYYNCLLTYAKQNWHSPLTGEKKKITACCRDCKLNAPALNSQRDKELVKLITSYKQAGDIHKQIEASLAKLLKPIK